VLNVARCLKERTKRHIRSVRIVDMYKICWDKWGRLIRVYIEGRHRVELIKQVEMWPRRCSKRKGQVI